MRVLLYIITIVLLGTTHAAAIGFGAAANFATGVNPHAVTTADFNGDGNVDVAVANQTSNNASVLLGNGAGGFSTAVNYAVGTAPRSVTTADFNGDGNIDMVLGNYGSNNVSVLLGSGTGGFGAAVNYAVGTAPLSVTTADFNGDGNIDVAVANILSNNFSILLGNGAGGFGAAANFVAGTNPQSLITADFNGDGNVDIAVANQNSNNVSVLLGNGVGGFGVVANFAAGLIPFSIAVTDFNGDGNVDMVVANASSNNVSIFLGNGTGSFSAAVNYAVGTDPRSVTTADFNGDGNVDIIVACPFSQDIRVLLGNGAGGFGAATNFVAGTSPQEVTTADFNGDGNADIAVANFNSGNVSILLNQPIESVGGVPPVGTISIDAGNGLTNNAVVTLTMTCSDAATAGFTPSGCAQMQFSNDNVTWGALLANATSASHTLSAGADGVRTVYARFQDTAGNAAVVSDTITLDTIAPAAPSIGVPANNVVSNNQNITISGAAETSSSVNIKDNATSIGLVTATGGNWSLATPTLTEGAHNFTAIATDAAGNVSAASTAIAYAVDITIPVISLSGAATVTNEAGSTYTDAGASWSDAVDGTGAITGVGTVNTAVVGSYTLTYGYTDVAGNAAQQVTRTVQVLDTTAPVIAGTPLADVVAQATGTVTTVNLTSPTATDLFAATVTNDASVSFPVGTTVVTWTAADANGNSTTAAQNVIVQDTIAPVISLSGAATVTNEAGSTYTDAGASWSDAVDGTGAITGVGTVNTAVVGSYTLTYGYTDVAGNAAPQVTRTVQVLDTTAPVIAGTPLADVVAQATGTVTTVNLTSPTATDLFAATVTNDASVSFPVGTTTVTWTATDANGNGTTATQNVIVQDGSTGNDAQSPSGGGGCLVPQASSSAGVFPMLLSMTIGLIAVRRRKRA